MTPQTLTLISGVVLLLVFVAVGWSVRRRRTGRERTSRDRDTDRNAAP